MNHIINISKEDTLVLKGCAILIMVYLHVFLKLERDVTLHNIIWYDGKPLSWWLTNFAAVCVSLYMFLSGYGMYITYLKGRAFFKLNMKRVTKLYMRAIFIATIFLPISLLIPTLGWHLDIWSILKTVSGYDPLNCEWWFLLPWAILCLLSPVLFRILSSKPSYIVLTFSFVLYLLVRYFIKWYGDDLYTGGGRFLLQILMVINLGFIFLMGGAFAKHGWLVKIRTITNNGIIHYVLLLVLVAIFILRTFFIKIGIFEPFIAAAFCIFVVLLPITERVRQCLMLLGKQSTTMWLVHTFLVVYYFPVFFYGLEYPVLIFVAAVIASLLMSILIDKLYYMTLGQVVK